ncbi:aspartyl-phosphate phosphatase Spo0E family protein [Clostridium sp. YIM B02515]|uniref:Aspartyl-phosphate phosphatase Spo0E family protein n=1 Tax=Clostridium rhizosphaerae TaxID=2803861 RepID=A0ABS1T989_9CLOT|nr:aspartyl-phosphate phosphatase Spo0E family protein [Clostridium rhizosphaerae]MBL4935241.1 aspartyl-phosphate phosphatase Spo0E family protein [Clostridium rhizosphaerae]
MELNIVLIIKKIDKLRKKLNNLVDSDRQLTDKKVVDCSQKLDKLLTEYEKIKKELKAKDAA